MNYYKRLCKSWGWFFALGILLIIVGTLALMMPLITTLSTMIVIGATLIALSVVEFVQILGDHTWKKRVMHAFLGLISGWIGAMFLFKPAESAIVATLFMAGFFIASGVMRITLAFMVPSRYWFLVLLNGIFSLLFGIVIWLEWPIAGLWIIGLFVGVDLVFNGVVLTIFAWNVRKQCTMSQQNS